MSAAIACRTTSIAKSIERRLQLQPGAADEWRPARKVNLYVAGRHGEPGLVDVRPLTVDFARDDQPAALFAALYQPPSNRRASSLCFFIKSSDSEQQIPLRWRRNWS